MPSLDALVNERIKVTAEEKSLRQSSKSRLIADSGITVTGLMHAISTFLHQKDSKDLWQLIQPPPGCPSSYGWRSKANGEWLVKTSNLLWELLEVAANSKIHSKKLVKSLSCLHKQHDLELRTWAGHSMADAVDRLDFTIRVLMFMLRQLKSETATKSKVYKGLSKRDQVCLDLLLGKLDLPEQFMLDGFVESEEDGAIKEIDTFPCPESLALVPFEGKAPSGKKKATCGLPELPDIFGKVLGKEGPEISEVKSQPEPQPLKLPSSLAFKAMGTKSTVTPLDLNKIVTAAMAHEPSKPAPKAKPKGKAAAKGKATAKPKAMEKETGKALPKKKSEAKPSKKKELTSQKAENTFGEYKPGEYQKVREEFIKDYIAGKQAEGEIVSKSMASDAFGTSMKRALLLCEVSLPELKRRRFVSKDCMVNPFKAMVESAKQ